MILPNFVYPLAVGMNAGLTIRFLCQREWVKTYARYAGATLNAVIAVRDDLYKKAVQASVDRAAFMVIAVHYLRRAPKHQIVLNQSDLMLDEDLFKLHVTTDATGAKTVTLDEGGDLPQ